MAALFKLARHDKPTERKIIKASTIDELISTAKLKLKLTDENYQIYTDDFTEIDEDDILLELAHSRASRGEQLLLTIVPDGISWNSNTLKEYTSNLSTGIRQDISSNSSTTSHQLLKEYIPSSSSSTPHPANDSAKCFSKFSTKIQTVLLNGESLEPKDYRSMVHTLRDYLIYDIKDTSRGRAEIISKQIITTYEQTFIPKIGNKSINAAVEALRQSIYYAANYQKGQSGKHKQISCLGESDDESTSAKPKAQDEYGCVAYLPNSPPSDVLEELERKRLKLRDYYSSPDSTITDEILTFMNECYYLQRKIIHNQKNLSLIFEKWPYFYHYKIILQHANQLLGKNTESIWKESINKLSKPINYWSKHDEIVREVKDRKKMVANEDGRYVREILRMAKNYSNNLKNDEPYHTVIFGLIAKFMQEDVQFLYVLIGEDVTDEEVIEHVPVVNPVLMIRGKDLHHDQNRYDVVIEKKILLHADTFKEGLLTTFLVYFVFGIVYPKEIEGTLEAIQRC